MAIKALTIGDTFEYVSDSDPAKNKGKRFEPVDPNDPSKGDVEVEGGHGEDASVFSLSPLDVFLMGSIYDKASNFNAAVGGSNEVVINTLINKTNIEAVKFGFRSVTNFRHPMTGAPVTPTFHKETVGRNVYDALDDVFLQYLGLRLIAELAGVIKERSEVSEESAKN